MGVLLVLVVYLANYGGGTSAADVAKRVGKLKSSAVCLCNVSKLCRRVSAVCIGKSGFSRSLGMSAVAATVLLLGKRARCPVFLSGGRGVGMRNGTGGLSRLGVRKGVCGRRFSTFRTALRNPTVPSRGVLRTGTRRFVHRRGGSFIDVCLLSGCFMRGRAPSFGGVGRLVSVVTKMLRSGPSVKRLARGVARVRGIGRNGATPFFDLPGRGKRGMAHLSGFGSGCVLVGF